MFRKVGGFVYVMSALVSMERSLARVQTSPVSIPWQDFPNADVLRMLHLIFNTLCVAMRYEPANAKFFQLEVIDFFNHISFAAQFICFRSQISTFTLYDQNNSSATVTILLID